jgi:hypothetical protein
MKRQPLRSQPRPRVGARSLPPQQLRQIRGGGGHATSELEQCGTGMTTSRNTLEVMRIEVIVVY